MSKRTRELISCLKGCLDILYDLQGNRVVDYVDTKRQIRRSEKALARHPDDVNKGQGNGLPLPTATNTGE